MERASSKRIENYIVSINRYNQTPDCGITRDVFTPEDLQARDYVKQEMKAIGLKVREDCIGNLYGILEGSEPKLAPVWTGSHIDTVRNGGMYDGMAGVFAGMEALRIIRESGQKVKRSLSVNVYTCEEMGRFGVCCVGSRALAGRYRKEDLKKFKDENGSSLYDTLEGLGYDLSRFHQLPKKKGEVYASLELHIEQNNILEKNKIPLGIVTGICAPTNLWVTVEGIQAHAGGTDMYQRRDAYMAAAEIALQLEELVLASDSRYMTGTIGKLSLVPNAVNVIPGKAVFSIDIRSVSMEDKEALLEQLAKRIREIEERRKVKIRVQMQNHDRPVLCDPHLMHILQEECRKSAVPCMELVSGAYHDSLMLGDFTKVGMLFVPCKDGISHSEKEWASCEDIAMGADVLAKAMLRLGNEI